MTWQEWRNSKYYEEKAGLKDAQDRYYVLAVKAGVEYMMVDDDVVRASWDDVINGCAYHTEK